MTGVDLIAKERARQIIDEKRDAKNDDLYAPGVLSHAGGTYALAAFRNAPMNADGIPAGWPWDPAWFKTGDALVMLAKSGALIAAEMDRVLRARGEAPASEMSDALYQRAVGHLAISGSASTLKLQQALGVSYDMAVALMGRAVADGYVTPGDKNGRRYVMLKVVTHD